jgi:hypothetical protein
VVGSWTAAVTRSRASLDAGAFTKKRMMLSPRATQMVGVTAVAPVGILRLDASFAACTAYVSLPAARAAPLRSTHEASAASKSPPGIRKYEFWSFHGANGVDVVRAPHGVALVAVVRRLTVFPTRPAPAELAGIARSDALSSATATPRRAMREAVVVDIGRQPFSS